MRNFGIVVPGLLYRSGRYHARDLLEVVKRYSIVRVIDLRDRLPLFKLRTYQHIGVEFVWVPINEYRGLPILPILDDVTTLIHCWRGAHRTGAAIARYRLEAGWSKREAWLEMQHYGFGDIAGHSMLFDSVFEGWRP